MLIVQQDYRLGNISRPYVTNNEQDINMQIPDEIRKCVAFICYKKAKSKEYIMAGTAFLTTTMTSDNIQECYYFVTAKHVIVGIHTNDLNNKIYIRINKKGGGFDYIPTSFEDWLNHPNQDISVDVSVLPFCNFYLYDCLAIPFNMMLNEKIIEQQSIGIGDEIFMTGLFSLHYGKENNIPIIRVGNIAAMPEESIATDKFGDIEAYLVELRSLGGLSGSPVFVHLSNTRVIDNQVKVRQGNFHLFYCLGLLHGHWELKNVTYDILVEDNVNNKQYQVNMGIGIVVPSIRILETVNQQILINQRENFVKKRQIENAPTMDIVGLPDEFDKLLNKAIECSPKDD
jgi:hypothetical protein